MIPTSLRSSATSRTPPAENTSEVPDDKPIQKIEMIIKEHEETLFNEKGPTAATGYPSEGEHTAAPLGDFVRSV